MCNTQQEPAAFSSRTPLCRVQGAAFAVAGAEGDGGHLALSTAQAAAGAGVAAAAAQQPYAPCPAGLEVGSSGREGGDSEEAVATPIAAAAAAAEAGAADEEAGFGSPPRPSRWEAAREGPSEFVGLQSPPPPPHRARLGQPLGGSNGHSGGAAGPAAHDLHAAAAVAGQDAEAAGALPGAPLHSQAEPQPQAQGKLRWRDLRDPQGPAGGSGSAHGGSPPPGQQHQQPPAAEEQGASGGGPGPAYDLQSPRPSMDRAVMR